MKNLKDFGFYFGELSFNSRKKALREIPLLTNTLIISFNDTLAEKTQVKNIECSDTNILITILCPDDEISFSKTAGRNIVLALENAKRLDMGVYVHCWAGISRSAAVSKFVNDHYKLNKPELENYNIYNKKIYRVLIEQMEEITNEKSYC